MDKPMSLSVKDYIVRKLAVKMMVSEKVLDAVIMHQFSSANDALKTNMSVEIAGFGKFLFNINKAHRKMEKMLSQRAMFESMLLRPNATEKQLHSAQVKLTNILTDIDILKLKLENAQFQTDIRRMEEQPDSTS
jgi:nucleoid DNA-binding protein